MDQPTYEQLQRALRALVFATDHYGYSDEQSQEFWESRADVAGVTSDDVRREVWQEAKSLIAA